MVRVAFALIGLALAAPAFAQAPSAGTALPDLSGSTPRTATERNAGADHQGAFDNKRYDEAIKELDKRYERWEAKARRATSGICDGCMGPARSRPQPAPEQTYDPYTEPSLDQPGQQATGPLDIRPRAQQ